MYFTAMAKFSSLMLAPPFAGMPPMPWMPCWMRASMPPRSLILACQPAGSPNLGAFRSPVAWQAAHTLL